MSICVRPASCGPTCKRPNSVQAVIAAAMNANPTRSLIRSIALACVLMAFSGVGAYGVEPHPQVGRLPGFPVIRGVVPVLASKAALADHEKLVSAAFAAVRARHAVAGAQTAEPNENFESECEDEAFYFETQDVCYRGGPVLHHVTVHLIFWQGSTTPPVEPFPAEYTHIIEGYFEDVAHDSGSLTNVFAIDAQYGEENSKGEFVPGEYSIAFNKNSDVTVDESPFPIVTKCVDETEYSEGPCLTDSEIQQEVSTVAKEKSWPAESLEDVYLVFTPPGVGGCFDSGTTEDCAYKQYCAYHSDFGGNGFTPGDQTLYADLPYIGEVRGCDSGVHPNEEVSSAQEREGEDGGADAVIDTASHELNETITDPLGSQCKSGAQDASECERNAWTDAIGQEVGDKCLPPEATLDGIYGEPLGELIAGRPASSYNQLIDGGHYWTQREWSNEAGVLEGGCVQRLIEAKILVSANAEATVPVTFDGSASGAAGDPAVYWVWDFGGEQVGTSNPRITHTYTQPGEYLIALTAYDAYGNAQATLGVLTVLRAPPSPPVPVNLSSLPMKEVKEVKVPLAVARYSSAQIAALLGLPANGARVPASSSITLGHASCPPACAVTLNLYAKVAGRGHSHRRVLIGKLSDVAIAKAQQPIVLKLNASARKLLRTHRRLAVTLKLVVVGREGASWSIGRSLILTG